MSSLSPEEKHQFTHLIEDRHGYANLVLMCGNHSIVIDNPRAGHDVAAVVAMKRDHEAAAHSRRSQEERREGDLVLRYAAIVDEWERRVALDEWRYWLGPVFGDGHPRMRREHFDRLTETRMWLFSRVWPGTEPILEEAFENFRWVAQDLQLVLEQYPHETLAKRGWVAPQRFYNDRSWYAQVSDHHRLDELYEWYANLLEDLALELTRAANLVCEAIRQTIDPRFRLDEGMVVLESGPYENFLTQLHRSRYGTANGWSPYRGLHEFVSARGQRDEHRGTGGVPDELRLPGDSLFS